MNERVRSALDDSLKRGRKLFLSKFLTKRMRRHIESGNDLESIAGQMASDVRDLLERMDITDEASLDAFCAELDKVLCPENRKERFLRAYNKAYSRVGGIDKYQKWQEFEMWLQEYRSQVRRKIVKAMQPVVDVEAETQRAPQADSNHRFEPDDPLTVIEKVVHAMNLPDDLEDPLTELLLALQLDDEEAALEHAAALQKAFNVKETEIAMLEREVEFLEEERNAAQRRSRVLAGALRTYREQVGRFSQMTTDLHEAVQEMETSTDLSDPPPSDTLPKTGEGTCH